MIATATDAGAAAGHRRDQRIVTNYHQRERGNCDPARTFPQVFHGTSPLKALSAEQGNTGSRRANVTGITHS
jgi:hypothetical protein